nr:hypothetical protein BSM_31340 [uncultured archaeon]CBH39781.1 hypothetical protein BSM_32600 [uncultured archaeon]
MAPKKNTHPSMMNLTISADIGAKDSPIPPTATLIGAHIFLSSYFFSCFYVYILLSIFSDITCMCYYFIVD